MPKNYAMGGRTAPPKPGDALPAPERQSWRARLGALRNLPPFLKLVWRTSPALTLSQSLLRIVRALLPVATLYVGKLIIDEVVLLVQAPHAVEGLEQWLASGLLDRIGGLLVLEFGLAVFSDVLGRAVSLLDSVLSERFSNEISLRLMEHAATLDLEDFEDSELQDRLERARRQAAGRSSLIGQLFSQAQDVVTVVSFAAGLLIYAPWLIAFLAIALLPAFVGEAHFNAQSYSLNYARTPERRELDYVRQTGASAETAKEVKIFGLNAFLIERYRTLATSFFEANRRIALRRAGWGSLLSAIGTIAYYVAYAYIVWRTLHGDFSIGDLTFLAGSFRRLRNLLENLLMGFSQVAGQALYLDDLFSFFEIQPEIVPPPNPRPFPVPIRGGFAFENVGFRYPGAERWAVRGMTFELHAGEVLALVGENGAGKTTLVKLLARLYDPDEGRILLDGHDLREYDLLAIRANIGVIFQDFVRYHFTAADNIAVGRIEARDDRAAHHRCRRAQPGGRGHSEASPGIRSDSRQALSNRHRPLRRRVAEDRHRACLHARRAASDSRRAHGGARRAFGVRGVQALQGIEQGQDGGTDIAPLFQRPHGRSHRGADGRRRRSHGHPRRTAGAGRALCGIVRIAGRGLPIAAARGQRNPGGKSGRARARPPSEPWHTACG